MSFGLDDVFLILTVTSAAAAVVLKICQIVLSPGDKTNWARGVAAAAALISGVLSARVLLQGHDLSGVATATAIPVLLFLAVHIYYALVGR